MEPAEIKSIDTIFDEISKFNPERTEDDNRQLRKDFFIIRDYKNQINCSLKEIKCWAESLEQRSNKPSKHEAIAAIWNAMELSSGHTIRDVQILSLLLLYHPCSGRMVQVDTGEGKTIVIAMMAALFGLNGHKIDIGK